MEEITWDSFDNEFSDAINSKYLPEHGEGDTKATQCITAVNKLIYKWFNDGDVYDNSWFLDGWCNDLSTYANWLHEYVPETQQILERIQDTNSENKYTKLLWDLYTATFNDKLLKKLEEEPKEDSVYECTGPFEFHEKLECLGCSCVFNAEDLTDGYCDECARQLEEEDEEEEEDEDWDED